MASWSDLENARPDLAGHGRRLFQIEDPAAPVAAGLGYLATVRAEDGGPRVHPISPAILDGRLYAFIVRTSPKRRDLSTDPRFALHSWPVPFEENAFRDEEFYVTGRARLVEDDAMRQRVAGAVGDAPETGDVFEFDIDRVLFKARPGGRLTYTRWPERTSDVIP